MENIIFCKDCSTKIGEAKPGAKPFYCQPCRLERKRMWAREAAKRQREKHPEKVRAAGKKWRDANPEKVSANNKDFYEKNKEQEKQRVKDYRDKNPEKCKEATRSWRERNLERHREMTALWAQENKEYRKQYRREQYLKNKEKENERSRAYKLEHKERLKARQAEYNRLFPERNRANVSRRNAAKKQAIPLWANFDKIAEIYAEAARITAETGIPHDVDHIVPLQSKWVCGLHVETNLQILTASENRSKSNRHWPDALKDFPYQET